MGNCCKDAPVEKYASDCGLYCLSVGQSVADLQKCFQDDGISAQLIFCNANNTATATGKPDSTSNPTASGTKGSSTTAAHSTGAAPGLAVQQGVSKAGLGVLAMLVISAAAGALL